MQVAVMLALVVWLFVETQGAVNRDIKRDGKARHKLVVERRNYAIVTTFFALSYLGRCFSNITACGSIIAGDFSITFALYLIY